MAKGKGTFRFKVRCQGYQDPEPLVVVSSLPSVEPRKDPQHRRDFLGKCRRKQRIFVMPWFISSALGVNQTSYPFSSTFKCMISPIDLGGQRPTHRCQIHANYSKVGESQGTCPEQICDECERWGLLVPLTPRPYCRYGWAADSSDPVIWRSVCPPISVYITEFTFGIDKTKANETPRYSSALH